MQRRNSIMTYEEEYFTYTNKQKLKIKQMEQTTISLQTPKTEADPNAVYMIDFSKLQSVNDLVLILAAMGISFSPAHPNWGMIEKFANLDNPIYPNQQIVPEKKEISLPKLKTLNKDGK